MERAALERLATNDHAGIMLGVSTRPGMVVVDVGCGSGGFVRWLRRRGADPIGIECSVGLRAEAIAADPDHAKRYLDGVGQDLPLESDSVDAVTFMSSLHHIPAEAVADALQEAARVTRPGGLVYVSEPMAEGPGYEVGRLIDDEAEVRAHAQTVLTRADEFALTLVDSGRFLDQHVYPDAASFGSHMVGINQARAARYETLRDEVDQAFHRHGRPTTHGYAFDQPKRFHLFRV
jgi:ubiquinone/menaquinone biosynthesis C-methylase UbiE